MQAAMIKRLSIEVTSALLIALMMFAPLAMPVTAAVTGRIYEEVVEEETKYVGQALPTRSMTADGRDIYVELSFAIVKDASGTVTGAMAHARDITERFERDRQMRREIRELREAAEARQ